MCNRSSPSSYSPTPSPTRAPVGPSSTGPTSITRSWTIRVGSRIGSPETAIGAKSAPALGIPVLVKKIGHRIQGTPESAEMFFRRKLTPIESGCCKPPTSCGYTYMNETYWVSEGGVVGSDPDCLKWSVDQQLLCYNCDSCKAGVLASLKKSWRKVSIINIVMLIIVYVVACAAFRHNKRVDNDEPYGETRMEKSQPSRIHF
ncbi:hypothetical protein ACS0TY_002033 [Phlomoides rotata]